MIFGLKSMPVELHYLLEDDIATPTALVGKKMAPILQKADGSHMAESMDILHHIDALQEPKVAAPLAAISPISQWVEAAFRPVLNLAIPRLTDADLPEFATPAARAAFKTRQAKNFGDLDALLAQSAELIGAVQGHLALLDPLLAGRKQVDADDFALYPVLRMLSIVKGVEYPSNVSAYLARMEEATGVNLHSDQAH